ncbi:MAG: glycosyltransferase [Candidatus Goldbacteria bacterium]|nr:glycosyltransferase [Candidatus Goldiibacteriota bacterium]
MHLKEKSIIEAGHITEVYGPVQALRNYLITNCNNFIYISHPFSYSKLEGTEVIYYKNGKEEKKEKGHKRIGFQFLQWIKDFFFNIRFGFKIKGKIDIFIGVDNLNAFSGIILKKLGKVKKVYYYIIDHMDRRFKNPFFNFLYNLIDGIACKNSDIIWSLSHRIQDAKNKRFKLKAEKNIVVPVGVELEKIDTFTMDEKLSKKTMVFMSMLDETKGVDMMIEAMKDIVKAVPTAKLLIIGTGPYEGKLRELTEKLGLTKCVEFLGVMDHDTLFKFIPHERIGIASYKNERNSYTYYADPTKPKEYLACGLPVVITDVPWIAEEIRNRPMGVACQYFKEDIVRACIKLLKDDAFYLICLKNAIEFTANLSWDKIYNEAFSKSPS